MREVLKKSIIHSCISLAIFKFTCKSKHRSNWQKNKRFVYLNGGGAEVISDLPGKKAKSAEVTSDLDKITDKNQEKNRELAEQFQRDFADKIVKSSEGDTLELHDIKKPDTNQKIDFKYVFLIKPNTVTLHITKTNFTEEKETGTTEMHFSWS